MRILMGLICTLTLLVPVFAGRSAHAAETTAAETVSYRREIEPIFRKHCFGCHQGAKQLGEYRMTDFSSLVAGGESGAPAIVPGKPDESYLIDQITPLGGEAAMPKPPKPPLESEQIELISRWIAQGANDDSPAEAGPAYDADHPPVYTGEPTLPSLDVSPDGRRVAIAGFHEVLIVDAASGELRDRLIGLSPRLNSVRFSPDGSRLAAVGGTPAVSGEVQIWDVEAGELVLSRQLTFDTLAGASWSPDGSKLAFGAKDNVVRAIDSLTGEQVLFQGAHEDWVRDTVFTADGSHLISVARDMSCKLTEVETERFVDNVTSITPGALSGGLSSITRHPQRDEIVVGGADGVAKVYRVFRETQRRIGDDANLVRRLPKMPGRIFSVAVSPDGSRIAAAATLDGQSEVRVWKYDFDGKLSDELKTIMAKRVSNRKPEEREKVRGYRNAETEELARYRIDHAATYAVGFGDDNALVMASGDGVVRRLPDGASQAAPLYRIEIQPADQSKRLTFDAARHHEMVAQRAEDLAAERQPAAGQVQSLRIEPSEIELQSPYAYAQLVVTATLRNGATIDVTRLCEITPPEFARVTPRGLVRPIDDGAGSILVSLGELRDSVGLVASGTDEGAVDFVRDVGPVLSQLGCNQGTCHGAQKGKNGFRLSLRGYDPVFDVRALTDDLAARRINLASPDASLMLRKPLGLAPHEGGVLISQGDPYHSVLRRWIADGSELDLDAPRVDRIAVSPVNPVVQSTDARQQVRVVAHYTDGTSRDVTREAFIESGNTEVATTDGDGLLSAVRRGEAPILARYEGAYAATTLTVMGDRSGYREPNVETWSRIDELVAEKWQRVKVVPSELCDDATFLRRVYLDLTGLPPTSDEVRAFLSDPAPSRVKRTAVVDRLIGSEPFIEYWTNKWADLLQVNRKFLGVEGSEKFRTWIRKAVAENRPYNEFSRELLTATGSNNDNPAASYFKILRTPEDTMENTTHLFLGIRFNCNKCHDHPFERWTQDQYYEMAAFFARVGLQRDPASGNRRIGGTAVEGAKPLFEKVVDLDEGEVEHAGTGKVVPPAFPFPVEHEAAENSTRRQRLASWVTDPDNPYFARSYVNRLWSYLLGTGLIEPVDDIRAGNPPTNPRLLDHLTQSFVDSGFDMRQILRMICTSRTYQLSVETNPLNEDDTLNYSHAIPRRLPAEVIYDAVHSVTGAVSDIPGADKGTRAAELTDAGVKLADGFLQNLGRPVRESACECERSSELQLGPVMALINGPTIGSAIADPKNELERIVQETPDDGALTEEIFLRVLGRFPSDAEMAACEQMTGQIRQDHEALVRRLEEAEAEWERRHAELEAERKGKLAATENQIAERKKAIEPERAQLENARLQRIEQAEQKLAEVREQLAGLADAWAAEQKLSTEWHPLLPTELSTTNQAKLVALGDRSVVATGAKDKGVYTVKFRSKLSGITGFRLEAMADPQLPSSGPGLAGNGNFVLTELEIEAAPASAPDNRTPVKIASGRADYSQNGFSVEATFDGKQQDQGGWAVAGATGVVHWASLKLAKPLAYEDGVVLTVRLHQFHNAAEHRLGRFRISATTDSGEIPLGLPEAFASTVSTPEKNRRDEDRQRIAAYLGSTDAKVKQAQAELAKAKQPVPPDETLTRLEQQRERLSQPIGVDPDLVRLREDVAQSAKQLENVRLTAAEDLTWALVNSPAFLFNR